jgi:phosphoglycerate dehydrogenase-like enzyme
VSRAARVWLGPERPTALRHAIHESGGVEVDIAEANAIVWSALDHDVSAMSGLLHPGIEWVQLDVAGVDHWIDAGLIDDGRLWTSARGRYGAAVAEHVVALLLASARSFVGQARAAGWRPVQGRLLAEATIGFLGAGGLAQESIARLAPFGARILTLSEPSAQLSCADDSFTLDGLDEFLRLSDYVVVAVPLTPATRGMIGTRELDLIGPEGFLVNVARGPVVDTEALTAALADGRLGGAGLDVTDPEPLPQDHPLWGMDNVLITSHSANGNEMKRSAYNVLVAENVARFRRGEDPREPIDLTLGY